MGDILLSELTPNFIHDFDIFLKVKKKWVRNTAVNHLENIRKVIRIVLRNDWIKKRLFAGIKFKHTSTTSRSF
ncbi:MAG: phage integrase SAM-like domain-containing protein [Candidatus Azobacteroides sp.]|nr:phage integrase SAM-like domain-containing protein [Candidatus Azobacteroides sp.]